jgi:hypothetical protein
MTTEQKDWAESSGSNWASLKGDPRIVHGAEVLVGKHRAVVTNSDYGRLDWTDDHAPWVGHRLRVCEVPGTRYGAGVAFLGVCGRKPGCLFRVRDLVCLRTADGELTLEGNTLHRLDEWGTDSTPVEYVETDAALVWAVRAGLLELCVGRRDHYQVNPTRLDMALGREPEAKPAVAEEAPERLCSTCEHERVSGADGPESPCAKCLRGRQHWTSCRAVEYAPRWEPKVVSSPVKTTPRECAICHRPLDPGRDRFDLFGRCSDCGFGDERHAARAVAAREDTSGDELLLDLRRFISGPCGRPR